MSVQNIISKIDNYQMAIESIDVLVNDHEDHFLTPTLTYLKEQKQKTAQELSTIHKTMEDRNEEINRLSHI